MNENIKGCFAKSIAGHDKGTVYVIINVYNGYVYLSDGRLKTVENPKKKKFKHIQITNIMDDNIESKHDKNINITHEDIKRAIKNYISN